MQQTVAKDKTIAPLLNVSLFAGLVETVMNRAPDLPGMACFYGPSGYGKTFASTYASNKYRAFVVQIKSVWTRKKLCEQILSEMSIDQERTVPAMVDQIAEELSNSHRPLIIDEADFLVQKGLIEIVRDIYESSNSSVILIGEENMPSALRKWERIHNRMLDMKRAQPASLDDTRHLARLYCPGVDLADDMLAAIHEAAAGCTRRICVSLDRVRDYAAARGATALCRADYDGELFSGRPGGRS
ncbi:ATP-binding protein [Fundidesulfovibrio butyratiphilus]